MDAKYNIKATSKNLYVLIVFLSVLIGAVIPTYLLSIISYKFNAVVYYGIDLLVCFLLIHFSKSLTKKTALITISDKQMILNLPSFISSQRNITELPWSDLKSFLIEPNQYFTQTKFKLKNGKKVVFYHDTDDSKADDYIAFELALNKMVFKINKELKSKQILQKKTFYATTLGRYSAILLAITLLIIPFAYAIRNIAPPLGYLLVLYPGGIHFIWIVYKSKSNPPI
jgi:hypothetical protein